MVLVHSSTGTEVSLQYFSASADDEYSVQLIRFAASRLPVDHKSEHLWHLGVRCEVQLGTVGRRPPNGQLRWDLDQARIGALTVDSHLV
jgi:hypothetical protein